MSTTTVTSPSSTTTTLQPYLFFGGRCEEAIAFYRQALDAEVEMMMRFKQSPDPIPAGMLPPGFEDKIMHSYLRIAGNLIMMSDGCNPSTFGGFSLALNFPTERKVDSVFNALAEGGKVEMPLGKTFWSARFGTVTDRFGVSWMVGVTTEMSRG